MEYGFIALLPDTPSAVEPQLAGALAGGRQWGSALAVPGGDGLLPAGQWYADEPACGIEVHCADLGGADDIERAGGRVLVGGADGAVHAAPCVGASGAQLGIHCSEWRWLSGAVPVHGILLFSGWRG